MKIKLEKKSIQKLLNYIFVSFLLSNVSSPPAQASVCKQFSTSKGATSPEVEQCKNKSNPDKLNKDGLLISYVSKNGYVNGIAVFQNKKFSQATENVSASVATFYEVSGNKTWKSACEFNFDSMGTDRCVWYAHISKDAPKEWMLVANIPKVEALAQKEAQKANDWFTKNKGKCQKMGELSNCVTPQVFLVTDLNKNGAPEIWHQEIYAWEFGAGMTEVDLKQEKILTNVSVCHGCD